MFAQACRVCPPPCRRSTGGASCEPKISAVSSTPSPARRTVEDSMWILFPMAPETFVSWCSNSPSPSFLRLEYEAAASREPKPMPEPCRAALICCSCTVGALTAAGQDIHLHTPQGRAAEVGKYLLASYLIGYYLLMTDPALRDLFGLELGLLARWWRSKLDERLRPLGLSQARWTALWHLARGGDGLTQKQLARAVGVEGPSMVRVLDALERDGLVERRQPPPGPARPCPLSHQQGSGRARQHRRAGRGDPNVPAVGCQ